MVSNVGLQDCKTVQDCRTAGLQGRREGEGDKDSKLCYLEVTWEGCSVGQFDATKSHSHL